MEYIFNPKRKLFSVIILVFSFEIVILDETIELTIKNFTNSYSKATNYHFSQESGESLPNYIKIELEGQNPENNYIISYYKQDESFRETNQLSKSISGKAFMWLNKDQIQKGFYLNVECSDSTCEYSLNLALYEKILINLGEPYNFYVTEENKDTTFTIFIQPEDYVILNDYGLKVTIWAKGNNEITSELKAKDYIKHPKYNAYLFPISSLEVNEYEFKVKGTVGDFINIGGLLFDGMNICAHIIKDLGFEISAFLVKEKLDDAFFLFSNTSGLIRTIYNFDYDYEHSNFLNSENSTKIDYKKVFIRLEPYDNFSFSSVQFIGISDIETKAPKKINIYPPQNLGLTFERTIDKDEIIGLIPMNPGKDFTYFTYHTAAKHGEFKAYIYKCENYPLCKLDANSLKDSEKLLDYNSASISYNKSEYNENISPISKKQNMLLLKCLTESCKLFTTMYTNKNKLNIFLTVPYYKYIRKDNEDNYYMSIKKSFMNSFSIMKENTYIYVNIEIISGNISINTKINEEYSQENKKLFIFKMDKLNDFSLNISANKNSMYSIGASIHTDDIDIITPNINYLLKINKSKTENALIFADELESSESTIPNYFGFFNEKCNIEVKNSNSPISFTDNFAQDYQTIDNKFKTIQYKVNKVKNENTNCLFSTSMYNLKDENSPIILGTGVNYPFMFNENTIKINFMHIATEKEKDLTINLNILDMSEYNLTLFINEQEIERFNFIESNNITINSSSLIDNCKENNQPCKLNFIIESKNNTSNSIIEIKVIPQEEDYEDEDKEDEDKEDEDKENEDKEDEDKEDEDKEDEDKEGEDKEDEDKEDEDKEDEDEDKEDEDEDEHEHEHEEENKDKDNKKDEKDDGGDNKTLFIILGAVGGLILLIIIVILIIKCKRKSDANLKEKIEEVFEQETNELSLLQKDEK